VRTVFPNLPQAVAEGRDEKDSLLGARFTLETCRTHLAVRGQRPPVPRT
jgi:hypothetical protein